MEIFLFGICVASGLFFIVADVVRLPTIASEKALVNVANHNANKVSTLDVLVAELSVKLANVITLNEYKKLRLQTLLNASNFGKTAEEYVASCILKGAVIGVWAVPCLLIFPVGSIVFGALAVAVYFKELGKPDELLKSKRDKIEVELPRFVATISQELRHNRDILRIIDSYKPSAREDFAKELDVLTADMRSGSYETALTRFESTINSPLLSDMVRGLIAVLRGDDAVVYFEMLSHDMKQLEVQKLRQEAGKIPAKIKKYSFLMLMCFSGIYVIVLVYQLIISMSNLF